ncbi:N-acetylglucosaminyltransferase [Trichoderma parareesei]|uniref:N-acetylglucosaminyltransferase n=1 Tax=Trichoderma parareesei TaxID=858221 RepID=A0A2H3A2W5_TRIPA|nr:N-acetylglucosaminyltransferase [Trichoderma parareesei]
MTVRFEKSTAHCFSVLASGRCRTVLVVAGVIITVYALLSRIDEFYHQQPPYALKQSSKPTDGTDWSRFAYTQYVTNSLYLCNSVMLLERLHHLGSRADRVLMYPEKMLPDPETWDDGGFQDAELLIKARDEYGVKLKPIQVQHRETVDDTWSDSYTKLLAFNQTHYERVIAIDADVALLKHMDELFLLPPCPVAMPRAYWLLDKANITSRMALASHVMVIQPSEREFARIQSRVERAADDEYDMELLNKMYADTAMVLPHRPYTMLSSEFRETNHGLYLGSDDAGEWDPAAVLREARTVHFSDYPMPKPWKKKLTAWDEMNIRDLEPRCEVKRSEEEEEDCSAREAWRWLYSDFRERKAVSLLKKLNVE